MATAAQVATFIQTIAPLVQKYAKQYGYKVASPIIAQACCESAYGTSWISKEPYFNFFGMKCGSAWKGRSVSARTKEEYQVGVLTSIVDNFRAYDSYEEGVEGYFKFINWSRYANLKTATTPKQYLEYIKADGYALDDADIVHGASLVKIGEGDLPFFLVHAKRLDGRRDLLDQCQMSIPVAVDRGVDHFLQCGAAQASGIPG